jgi:hypothetical protein
MSIKTRITITAALILGNLSIVPAALADDAGARFAEARSVGNGTENRGVVDCPTLEGYPDCYPDDRASWDDWSSNSWPYRSHHPRRP